MIKKFKTEFQFGETVFLRTQPDTLRVVSGFLLRPGNVTIGLACGESESWHQMNEVAPMHRTVKVKGFKG